MDSLFSPTLELMRLSFRVSYGGIDDPSDLNDGVDRNTRQAAVFTDQLCV